MHYRMQDIIYTDFCMRLEIQVITSVQSRFMQAERQRELHSIYLSTNIENISKIMKKITMNDSDGKLEYFRYEMPKKEFDKSKFDFVDKGMKSEPLYEGMMVVENDNKVSVWFNFKH